LYRLPFSSPVAVWLGTGQRGTCQRQIRDVHQAMAAMHRRGVKAFKDVRAVRPGVCLIAASALARAHADPTPEAVANARRAFEALAKAAGILAGL
jgi:hypothetical protein